MKATHDPKMKKFLDLVAIPIGGFDMELLWSQIDE